MQIVNVSRAMGYVMIEGNYILTCSKREGSNRLSGVGVISVHYWVLR